MLRQILFLVQKEALSDEGLGSKVQETADYVRECGYESHILAIGAASLDGVKEIEKETTLVVTDSAVMAVGLLDKGYFTVGFYHELNKDEDFIGLKYVFEEIDQVDMDSFVKVYQRYAEEPWEILRTERLLVRETTVEDVDEFYRLYKDPEMTRYMEGLFENPEDEKRYQRDYIKKVYGFYGFGTWTVVRLSDNKIIGRAGFSMRNGFDQIELGFLIGKEYQRQGYAYEVCKAILEYGKNILSLDRVQTLVKKENTVSRHLCERLGFTEVGEKDVEENIYGRAYSGADTVSLSEAKYGKYIQYLLEF